MKIRVSVEIELHNVLPTTMPIDVARALERALRYDRRGFADELRQVGCLYGSDEDGSVYVRALELVSR